MAISLQDCERRIQILESNESSSWTSGSGWVKDNVTGLLIQWGRTTGTTVRLPKSYSNTSYGVVLGYESSVTAAVWVSLLGVTGVSTSSFNTVGANNYISAYRWITIGILYTNRVLSSMFKEVVSWLSL